MANYRDPSTRADRATAIVAVAAVHLGMAALLLLGGRAADPPMAAQAPTKLIDVTLPPPPPPAAPEAAARPDREAGAAGMKADPTPIVLSPPRIALPTPNPLPAAPIAGSGSAASAGAANTGIGPGAGGSGDGRGGGGAGGAGGIGENARLLSGGLGRRDYRQLRSSAAPSGRAMLAILIGPDGRVVLCSTRQSSGDPALDAALCAILQPRMRWAPARDRSGKPLTVGILYTAVWSRN